jgi:hypothetical protein
MIKVSLQAGTLQLGVGSWGQAIELLEVTLDAMVVATDQVLEWLHWIKVDTLHLICANVIGLSIPGTAHIVGDP